MIAPVLRPVKPARGYQSTWLRPNVLAKVTSMVENAPRSWNLLVDGGHIGAVRCPYAKGEEFAVDGKSAIIRRIDVAKVGEAWYWAIYYEKVAPHFFGLPICKHCEKPQMNCDCEAPFQAIDHEHDWIAYVDCSADSPAAVSADAGLEVCYVCSALRKRQQ